MDLSSWLLGSGKGVPLHNSATAHQSPRRTSIMISVTSLHNSATARQSPRRMAIMISVTWNDYSMITLDPP